MTLSQAPPSHTAQSEDCAELLASYLAARDVGCPGCGYNLRGCMASSCPECARPLELRIAGAADPRAEDRAMRLAFAWPFMLGVVWALSLAVNVLAARLATPASFGRIYGPAMYATYAVMLAVGLGALFALIRLHRQRGAVWTTSRRRAWARVSWAMLVVFAVLYSRLWMPILLLF